MVEKLAGGLQGALDSVAWRVEREVDASGKARLVWVQTDAGVVVRHNEEPEVSTWRKMAVWFIGLLPIESQL